MRSALSFLVLIVPALASAEDPNVAAWCDALEQSTVAIRGTIQRLGQTDTTGAVAEAGTGFWSRDLRGAVITSAFVIERMQAIEVCEAGGEVCHPVTGVTTSENTDVALLLTEAKPPGKYRFKTSSLAGESHPSILGGHDDKGGFVCGLGTLSATDGLRVSQTLDAHPLGGAPAVLYTGKKKPARMTVVATLAGSGPLGEEATHPLNPIGALPDDPSWLPPAAWRESVPWRPITRSIRVSMNRPVWIVSDVPPLQDLKITRDNAAVCVGLYRVDSSGAAALGAAPDLLAMTCGEGDLLYTTPGAQRIAVAAWTLDTAEQTANLEIGWR